MCVPSFAKGVLSLTKSFFLVAASRKLSGTCRFRAALLYTSGVQTPRPRLNNATSMSAVRVFPRRKGSERSCVCPEKGRVPLRFDLKSIQPLFALTQKDAAKHLGISLTALKKVCRKLGVRSWASARDMLSPGQYANARLAFQEAVRVQGAGSPESACSPASPPSPNLDFDSTASTSDSQPASKQGAKEPQRSDGNSLCAFLDSLVFDEMGPQIPSVVVDSDLMTMHKAPARVKPEEDDSWQWVGHSDQVQDDNDLSYLVALPRELCANAAKSRLETRECATPWPEWCRWYAESARRFDDLAVP